MATRAVPRVPGTPRLLGPRARHGTVLGTLVMKAIPTTETSPSTLGGSGGEAA